MADTWITTKGGDSGFTSLGNGERVPKDHRRVDLYGTVDECQAAIGLARATCCSPIIGERLLMIERQMGGVMGYLALFPGIPAPDTAGLESIIEEAGHVTGHTFSFVTPGDSLPGAALHMARTVARRAERLAVKLYRAGDLDEKAFAWINRLSDAIYALSLWTDKANKECEEK
ncbi:MAG: cob(I)yrinic acid a,c-diamide adenosyltransferase [Synergistota bacterium]|nr:cob(I)yrinic acid a,c-diamide adenosyltransferase [Synergistota bacterium]